MLRVMRNKYEKLLVVSLITFLVCLNVSYITRGTAKSNDPSKCPFNSSASGPGKYETHQVLSKTWTRISSSVFVYSAYLEDRQKGSPYIKIIGIKRVKKKLDPSEEFHHVVQDITKLKDEASIRLKYFCKLHYQENNEFKYIVSANVSFFVFEEGVKLYAGTFYKCHFNWIPNLSESESSTSSSSKELFISLHPLGVMGYPDKLVRIQKQRREFLTNLSVCVRPLFGPMDDLQKMAQFIAYYEAMGTSHFTFYDLSISPRVKNYLSKLGEETISIFQWNLPTGNVSELWDYGALTALQDCVYQSRGYVIIVDIDEFIVPRSGNSTLLEFLHEASYSTTYDQFCFRNVFYCDELCPPILNPLNNTNQNWNPMEKTSTSVINQRKEAHVGIRFHIDANFLEDHKLNSSFLLMSPRFQEIKLHKKPRPRHSLPIFACSRRTKKIWGTFNRAKYITRAEKVRSVGHHFVTTFTYSDDPRYSKFTWKVPTNLALLHHYRECGPLSSKANPIYKRVTVLDDRISLFKKLVERTRSYQIYENNKLD